MIASPRLPLAAFALLAFAAAGHAYESEKSPPAGLSDAEVRAHLQGDEVTRQARGERDRLDAERQISRARELAKGRKMDFAGAAPEQDRKAKADALIKAAEERLKELDRERDELRAAVAERIRKSATVVACPVLPLRDAVASGVTEVLGAARKAGYARVVGLGFILSSPTDRVRDPALSELLAESLAAAQPGGAAAAGPAAVLLAEMQPDTGAGGALVSLRLIDAQTMIVRHATLALVPADAATGERRPGQEPPMRLAVLEDRSNFLSKLGKAEAWPFEVAGDGPAACLLKAVIASRAKPPLRDPEALAVVTGKRVAAAEPTKAHWTQEPDPEAPGSWRIGSRAAGSRAKPAPVGVLRLVLKPEVKGAR